MQYTFSIYQRWKYLSWSFRFVLNHKKGRKKKKKMLFMTILFSYYQRSIGIRRTFPFVLYIYISWTETISVIVTKREIIFVNMFRNCMWSDTALILSLYTLLKCYFAPKTRPLPLKSIQQVRSLDSIENVCLVLILICLSYQDGDPDTSIY